MKRFYRFHRHTVRLLRQQRAQHARMSLQLTLAIMMLGGVLLTLQLSFRLSASAASFTGVNYSPPRSTAPQKAATPPISAVPAPDTEPLIPLLPTMPVLDESPLLLSIDTTELDAAGDIPSVFEPLDSPRISRQGSGAPPASGTAAVQPKQETALHPATPITTPQPPYPESMRKRRLEGELRLHISLDTGGIPTAVDIQSDAHPGFSDHTRRWILQHWRFSPAKRGDTAIASGINTTIRYCLH